MSIAEITEQVDRCQSESADDMFLSLQKVLLPLSPITCKKQYDQAMRIATALGALSSLPRPATDYLAVLARNIEAYEREHTSPTETRPIENLAFLLEENDLNGSDLGRILGHRTLGWKILNGQRKLSINNIRALAKHFSVSPELFL